MKAVEMGPKLESIFRDALARCAPERILSDRIEPRDGNSGFAMPAERFNVKLAPPAKLWVFGAGKASARMAAGLVAKLGAAREGGQIHGGAVVAPEGTADPGLGPVLLLEGSHPEPGSRSVFATRDLIEQAQRCSASDHVLFVLSGGASALLTDPVEGISVQDKALLARSLMNAGAPIDEINIVRRHLSRVKGGKLADKFVCPVTVLVFSDVVGNAFEAVGSGPFAADPFVCADAERILRARLGSTELVAQAVACLQESRKEVPSTVRHVLCADRSTLLESAASAAKAAGLSCVPDETPVQGEVDQLVERYVTLIERSRGQGKLYAFTGEPVMRTKQQVLGAGGRSQHLALSLAAKLKGVADWGFLAAGSDGIDGSSPAAGAWVDGQTWQKAERLKLNPEKLVASYQSGALAAGLEQAIVTGKTGNNLQDLHLIWVG